MVAMPVVYADFSKNGARDVLPSMAMIAPPLGSRQGVFRFSFPASGPSPLSAATAAASSGSETIDMASMNPMRYDELYIDSLLDDAFLRLQRSRSTAFAMRMRPSGVAGSRFS